MSNEDDILARAIFTHPTSPKPEPTAAPAVSAALAGAGDPNALLERAAATIYDNPSSKPLFDKPVEDKPEPKDALADALYAPKPLPAVTGIPEAITKLREASKGIYDAAAPFVDVIGIDKEDSVAQPTPEQLAAANELRLMMADSGISPVEGREIATLTRHLVAEPPTAEMETEWGREASKRLLDQNNQNLDAANRDLALAKQLVARDPRVARILEATRLGSHPRIIELMVERARAERAAGRL